MPEESKLREYAKKLVRELIDKQLGPSTEPHFLEVVWSKEKNPGQWMAAVSTTRVPGVYYQVTLSHESVWREEH